MEKLWPDDLQAETWWLNSSGKVENWSLPKGIPVWCTLQDMQCRSCRDSIRSFWWGIHFFFLNRNARPKAHSTDEEQNQKNSDSLKNKEQWPHERTTSNLNLWSYSYTALVGCFIPRLVHLCRACSVRSWPCIRALASKRHIHTPAYAVAACRWLSSQKSSSVFLKGGSAVDSLQEACAHAHTSRCH